MTGQINYIPNIPFATHNPSNDQPNMEANNNAVLTFSGVDHTPFNVPYSGTHSHVTFVNTQVVPALANGQNQIYPQTFGSPTTYLETYESAKSSGGAQLNGYLPFVKCIVHFTSLGANGTITADAGYLSANVGSIVQSGVGPGNQIVLTFATPLFYPAGPVSPYYIFNSYDDNITATGGVTMIITNSTITWTSGRTIGMGVIASFMVI